MGWTYLLPFVFYFLALIIIGEGLLFAGNRFGHRGMAGFALALMLLLSVSHYFHTLSTDPDTNNAILVSIAAFFPPVLLAYGGGLLLIRLKSQMDQQLYLLISTFVLSATSGFFLIAWILYITCKIGGNCNY